MTNYETIRIETEGPVKTITLDRPKKKNAMNPTLHDEMYEALTKQLHDTATKVLVITGAGDAFSAGMDLKEYFHDPSSDPVEMSRIRHVSQDWRGRLLPSLPCVTVAKVNGFCFGGAFPIVLGCDLAVAASEATFGLSEVNFGQVAGGPVSKMLSDLVHDRDSLWHLLTGEPFDGIRAAEMKLVNKAVPRNDLDEVVAKLAGTISEKRRETLVLAKRLYVNSKNMSRDAAFAYANATVAELTLATDSEWLKKGVGGFMRKEFKPGEGGPGAGETDE